MVVALLGPLRYASAARGDAAHARSSHALVCSGRQIERALYIVTPRWARRSFSRKFRRLGKFGVVLCDANIAARSMFAARLNRAAHQSRNR